MKASRCPSRGKPHSFLPNTISFFGLQKHSFNTKWTPLAFILHPVDLPSLLHTPQSRLHLKCKACWESQGNSQGDHYDLLSCVGIRNGGWIDMERRICAFQFKIFHHVNHELWNLSSKEKQRNMFTGYNGQCSLLILWTCFFNVIWRQTDTSWLQKIRCFVMESSQWRKKDPYCHWYWGCWNVIWSFPLLEVALRTLPHLPFQILWVESSKIFFKECTTGPFRTCRSYRWQILSVSNVSVSCFLPC